MEVKPDVIEKISRLNMAYSKYAETLQKNASQKEFYSAPTIQAAIGRLSKGDVRHLALDNIVINGEGGRALGVALRKNTSVVTLAIKKATFEQDGLRQLTKALEGKLFRSLYMDETRLDDDGLAQLADLLPSLTNLKKLSLKGNTFGAQGFSRLVNCLRKGTVALRELRILDNALGDDAWASLLDVLPSYPSLELLDATKCGLGERAGQALASYLLTDRRVLNLEVVVTDNNFTTSAKQALADAVRKNNLLSAMQDVYTLSADPTRQCELEESGGLTLSGLPEPEPVQAPGSDSDSNDHILPKPSQPHASSKPDDDTLWLWGAIAVAGAALLWGAFRR